MPISVFEPRFVGRPACYLVTIPYHKGFAVLHVLQTQGARMKVLFYYRIYVTLINLAIILTQLSRGSEIFIINFSKIRSRRIFHGYNRASMISITLLSN